MWSGLVWVRLRSTGHLLSAR